ncbi:pectinesterase family protein [Streptomyces sp. SPB162]|uniref:pectinesterase family protein n=1 Tax=Streptomyces sp. SPB162 TaxID=2940560 RepID=UPI00240670DC|nr:pectinesterase family protein [Streptomyces sp. SPB162]MDF9810969.1 pectinesterase [Streptomyces sp. SPB162]
MSLTRRAAVLGAAAAAAGSVTGFTRPGSRSARPFGRYGSPAGRRDDRTRYVDPRGRGDHLTVPAAVSATPDNPAEPWTVVLAAAVYRETVTVPAAKTGLTLIGASGDARDTVIVYDHANGTPKPDGSGTYGTSGSATTTVQADGFTARDLTFANDWLRADHPEITGTQAVALKTTGDRAAFHTCRFLGHQDTLYADTPARTTIARQYFHRCYVEGDVDFVFGRATAVFDTSHFRTLNRTDLASAPYGFVFAPSTAVSTPYGYLVVRSRISSTAPDGFYRLARPWVPSSDTTAVPMLTVRDSLLGAGINAPEPYANMSAAYPWQSQRFREYRNCGPGAAIPVPADRPQLTPGEAAAQTPADWFGDWAPWEECR